MIHGGLTELVEAPFGMLGKHLSREADMFVQIYFCESTSVQVTLQVSSLSRWWVRRNPANRSVDHGVQHPSLMSRLKTLVASGGNDQAHTPNENY